MIESFVYASEQPGPHFLTLGAVHGNEKCGTIAINRVRAEIDSGVLKLARGKVTFVPIANPRAYDKDKRFIERNLNRYLVPMEKPDCYEAQLGNILCPMLESCDVLLDIHSYTVGGAPFVNADDEWSQKFAASLGNYVVLTGWAEAYARTGRKMADANKNESTGTTEYARLHGAVAVTIECGQHLDPKSPEVAYQSIYNALRHLKMTDEPRQAKSRLSVPRLIAYTLVFYRDDEGRFPKDWKNLESVAKGQVMAFRASGEPISAPEDGVIIMPKANAPLGEEWFYFGVEKA